MGVVQGMSYGRYSYNQRREDYDSVWYQIFSSDNLLNADEIVQRLSDAEMTSNLFSDRELERLKKENKELKEEKEKLEKKFKLLEDKLWEFEEFYYLNIYEPSEMCDENVLCEMSNLFFSKKKED